MEFQGTYSDTHKNPVQNQLQLRANSVLAFNAMCHVFALRERTRQQITIPSLMQTMIKEGFTSFTKKQYQDELKFLASLGLGKIETDSKGRVKALKNIHVKLQSIGQAALGKDSVLKPFKPATMFKSLPIGKELGTASFETGKKALPKLPEPKKSPPVAKGDDFSATLNVVIDGKTMAFDLIPGISTKDLLSLIAKLVSNKAGV